jgi:mRNA interferase RelE/StbE
MTGYKAELSRLSVQKKLMPLRYKAELSRLPVQTKLMPLRYKAELSRLPVQTKLMPLRYKAELSRLPVQKKLMPLRYKAELSRLSVQKKLMPLRYKAELSRLSIQKKLMPPSGKRQTPRGDLTEPLRYKIFFKRSVSKDFSKIPKKDMRRIISKIESLAKNPRPAGCEKLSGQEKYRLRQGVYRILYSIQENELTILIVKVAHRREVYR